MRRIVTTILASIITAYAGKAQTLEKTDTLRASSITGEKQIIEHSSTQTGLQRIDGSKFNRGFALFNSPDIIKTLQTLPGVASGTELMSGLFVHGGDGTDNLFLLDGVPIYQCSHLIGLFSSFNSDVVDNLDFYKSGFPARYGGRTSSVIDIKTRDGDFNESHGNFAIGLIDGRFQLEGPIGSSGNTSFNVAVRRTWMDVVTRPIIAYINRKQVKEYGEENSEKIKGSYNFTDFNARLTHRFSHSDIIRFNLYAGADRLPIKYIDNYKYGEENEALGEMTEQYRDQADIDLYWGNVLASVSLEKEFNPALVCNATAYYSRNAGNIAFSMIEEDITKGNILDAGEKVWAKVHDIGLKTNFDWTPLPSHHVRSGFSAVYHKYNPVREFHTRLKEEIIDTTVTDNGSALYNAFEADIYAEDEFSLAKWLKVNAGIRLGLFSNGSSTYIRPEPRISLKAMLTDATSIRLSYADMTQYSHQIATTYLDLPTNTWMPSTRIISPMTSQQIAGGIYSELRKGLKVSLEGWWRKMDNMYEYVGTNMVYPAVDNWETDFTAGKGRSWGVEASLEYETERLAASAYYTLSWSERMFREIYYDWYPDRNDNRHKLNLIASYSFTKKFEAYAGWTYHSGCRTTAALYKTVTSMRSDFEVYDSPNCLQLPPYHRLDIGLNFKHKTKRGNTATWNLSVYNAYCRVNPIFGFIDYKEVWNEQKGYYELSDEKVMRTMGIIPIIPTLGYSIKF